MTTVVYLGEDISDPLFRFDNESIISMNVNSYVSMDMNEIVSDTAEIEVNCNEGGSDLQALAWATPVHVYTDGQLYTKLYAKRVVRKSANTYNIEAISAIGLMNYDVFYGGMYDGESFEEVAKSIILSNGFDAHGYWTGIHRGLYGEMKTLNNEAIDFCAVDLANGTTMSDVTLRFIDLNATFKLNKCVLNDLPFDPFPQKTSVRLYLLGALASAELEASSSSVANTYKKMNCGFYMNMSRSSTNSPWGNFGEVFFAFGSTKYSLGTPSSAQEYTISLSASDGTATINGTSYSISLDSSVQSIESKMLNYGGGVCYTESNNAMVVSRPSLYCDIEYKKYQVYNYDIFAKEKMDGTFVPHIKNPQYGINGSIGGWAKPYGDFLEIQKKQAFLNDLFARSNFENVSEVKIYGHIPVCTKREALHNLLFSYGVSMIKDSNGNYLFSGLPNQENEIDPDNIYDTGNVESIPQVNAIGITERYYFKNNDATPVDIYNSEEQYVDPFYVTFNNVAPVNFVESLKDVTINLYEYNCNACFISGYGRIYQRPYRVVEKKINKKIGNYPDGKEVTVDAFLVNNLNSESILDRLEACYKSDFKTTVNIVSSDEKCGMKYSFVNAFGETVSGYLTKAVTVFSGIVKKTCEFLVGFSPITPGNTYKNCVILTGSGNWTVPSSVFESGSPKIKVVLIGGGSGGESGYAGNDGVSVPLGVTSSVAADGGLGGKPGNGGKIFEVVIRNPQAQYSYSCGTGGSGGSACTSKTTNNKGTDGTETSFSGSGVSYTSANGSRSEVGYTDLINGRVYAKPWETDAWNEVILTLLNEKFGVGFGGPGGYMLSVLGNYLVLPGGKAQGIDGDTSPGGGIGSSYPSSGGAYAFGGCGGGGAIGGTAGKGGNASYTGGKYCAGNGGNGANAGNFPKATVYNRYYYGYGGHGGYGGGGGGSSGYAPTQNGKVGTGGKGGNGGRGGDGGDGCVVIYY